MRTDVAQIDLRLRRRSILWFTFGLAIYAFLIVAMYPSVKSDASLGALTADNPTVAAMLGVNGSLTSPTGWVNGNLYANFLPLMILLLTIGYGASSIAGQSEDGSLGLVATLPISRASVAALSWAFVLKWWTTSDDETPASAATSRMDVASKPRSANSRIAAPRIRAEAVRSSGAARMC